MAERKLKLLLPGARNLIDSKKWSVRNVLDLAGIGIYCEGNHFNSRDSEIEATVLRPGRVASYIMCACFDAGIIGADLVEEVGRDLGLTSLRYQRLGDLVSAIGLPKEKLCTYCWDGCNGCGK